MQNIPTHSSRYSKATSTQLLQDILTFNQQVQSPMTFAERYISVAASAHRLVSTLAGNHPDSSEEERAVLHMTNQMLDLIEDQMLVGLNYLQWAKYETSRGKQGIGLMRKCELVQRGEIQCHMEALLSAIDALDPVVISLKQVCPEPTRTLYQDLIHDVEAAKDPYPLNPWGELLRGLVLLGYKDKQQEASQCFLRAVLLLPECSSRAQKVILLTSVLRYCSL